MGTKKQFILIVEGHDMTGKTNIMNEVARRLNLKIFKNVREHNRWWDPEVDFKYGVEAITQMSEQLKLSFILDRFHASEYVYSKVFKRTTNEERVMNIDKRMAKMNAVIIYCYKTPAYYMDDDGEITPTDKYTPLKREYSKFLKITKCNVIKLCTDDYDLERQVSYIIKELKKMRLIE